MNMEYWKITQIHARNNLKKYDIMQIAKLTTYNCTLERYIISI